MEQIEILHGLRSDVLSEKTFEFLVNRCLRYEDYSGAVYCNSVMEMYGCIDMISKTTDFEDISYIKNAGDQSTVGFNSGSTITFLRMGDAMHEHRKCNYVLFSKHENMRDSVLSNILSKLHTQARPYVIKEYVEPTMTLEEFLKTQ